MDIIVNLKTLSTMRRFASGDMHKIGGYAYTSQKKQVLHCANPLPLPRSTPTAQGVHPKALSEFIDEIAKTNTHGLMVLRHGKVICEGYWHPYRGDYASMLYSLSKSVTCMAVGLAVEEGLIKLDERVVDIFKDKLPRIRPPRINLVTVTHLLNMSSGINFNESGSVMEKDWVRAILESDCTFTPGSKFFYNSINSYLLSAIVCKRTGMSLTEYLKPRLFEPMGIAPYWEVCPQGIEKGGWGIYLTVEEMAKLGQLMLNKGKWTVNGKETQLLPESWVQEASSCQIKCEKSNGSIGYGYQMWISPIEGAYQFNGAFGQYVIICPKQDMVIAITSGARSMFADSSISDALKKYLFTEDGLSDKPVRFKRAAQQRLLIKTANLKATPGKAEVPPKAAFLRIFQRLIPPKKTVRQYDTESKINGNSYALDRSLCGVLPLAVQAVHLNFTFGVSKIRFDFDSSSCRITMHEGTDLIVIVAGLDGMHRYSPITVRGEAYMTANIAKWTVDEFERPKLIVYTTFIETPHMRIMTFTFDSDTIILKYSEWPTAYDSSHMLVELVGGPGSKIEQLFSDASEIDGIKAKIDRFSEPRARGTLEKT